MPPHVLEPAYLRGLKHLDAYIVMRCFLSARKRRQKLPKRFELQLPYAWPAAKCKHCGIFMSPELLHSHVPP